MATWLVSLEKKLVVDLICHEGQNCPLHIVDAICRNFIKYVFKFRLNPNRHIKAALSSNPLVNIYVVIVLLFSVISGVLVAILTFLPSEDIESSSGLRPILRDYPGNFRYLLVADWLR